MSPLKQEQIYIPDLNSVYTKALTVLALIIIVIISGHKCTKAEILSRKKRQQQDGTELPM
jgi:hypothetical protein